MKKILLIFTIFMSIVLSYAQESALWLRYSSISPDGTTIAFCYKGDIFTVDVNGGLAHQLTTNKAYDFVPVWSHDSKIIAFASNRMGNFDVYTVPAEGGSPTRITFDSRGNKPMTFSKDDKTIYYTSHSATDVNYAQFPYSGFSTIYSISAEGGRPKLYSSVPMNELAFNQNGSLALYEDMKGFENKWRKHHTSSVTHDIWSFDPKTRKYTQLSDYEGENQEPVFCPSDNLYFYYLNEKSGSLNIYKRGIVNKEEVQLTHHKNHPVRFLSVSDNGTLCYSYNGELYTMNDNSQPRKLNITIRIDETEPDYKVSFMSGGISDMAVSPDGKEIAFILRGDVYVTSADYETTVRITNTPEQERDINFSPDGRKITYSSERNKRWQVFVKEIVKSEDKHFVYASDLKETQITDDNETCFQPSFSPDGEEIAFLYNRTTLKVINLKTKKIRTVLDGKYNYSYTDGDQFYQWSPDGKWFLVNYFEEGGWNSDDIGVVKSDGSGELHNLTQSGYGESAFEWVMDGKAIVWYTDKNGMRNHGSWGAQNDIYLMFFDHDAYDRFLMTKEEAELIEELDKEQKKSEKNDDSDEKDLKKDSAKTALPEVVYDFENAKDRIVRLTITSAQHGSCFLTKDGNKFYYLAAFEKGYDLWERDIKENKTRLVSKLGTYSAQLMANKDRSKLYMLSKGRISLVEFEKGTTKPVEINAEYTFQPAQERNYIYHHAWQQVVDKFYDPELHHVDWNMYGENYAKFLPYINNNYDFAEMLSELLGELNASHTGAGYRGEQNGDVTATFGMFFDNSYANDGLKIVEILDRNPMVKASSKMKPGVIILKIDGNTIKANEDYSRFLNHKAGKNVLLTLTDGKNEWEERVKPISYATEYELLYLRWVKQREELVDKLSDGKVGYVHVRSMDSYSFRKVYADVMGKNRNKQAIIIDTRFNGGGWLHDDLATLFSGKRYADFVPRGQYIASEPLNKWTKPSVVVMNESNYSDAHGFPFTYHALQIGKLIGMPVPGTMTAVWWETQIDNSLYFGIPQMGVKDLNNRYLENSQLEPDILISNDPNSLIEGKDLQIETAVKELMKNIK